jgi:hypothetical protein
MGWAESYVVDSLCFGIQPGVLQLGASGIIVAGPFVIVTGRGQGNGSDQLSINGAVELAPFLCGRPTIVSGKTLAIGDRCRLIALRADGGCECQQCKGALDSKHDRWRREQKAKQTTPLEGMRGA